MTPLWSLQATDAFGNATAERFGYALDGRATYSPSTGQMLSQSWDFFDKPAGFIPVDKIDYRYDVLGNLTRQSRAWRQYDEYLGNNPMNNRLLPEGYTNGTTFYKAEELEVHQYDALQRLKTTQRSGFGYVGNSAWDWSDKGTLSYDYDAVGNLTGKSDYASGYQYGQAGSGCGPNALSSLNAVAGGARSYRCDANGNQITQLTSVGAVERSLVYDGANLPSRISQGGVTIDYRYGPDNARYKGPNVYYGADGYELEIQGTSRSHRIELGPVVYTQTPDASTGLPVYKTAYVLRDRLGSAIALADRWGHFNDNPNSVNIANAFMAEGKTRRGYDAFGSPRRPNYAAQQNGPQLNQKPASMRGFTAHEHIDAVYLIHMNGRAFDYRSGRFLSVDPLIQSPANGQSLNPYSYIMNNPLSGKDPSGYQSCSQTSAKDAETGDSCTFMLKDARSANKLGVMATAVIGAFINAGNGADKQSLDSTGGKDQKAGADSKGSFKNVQHFTASGYTRNSDIVKRPTDLPKSTSATLEQIRRSPIGKKVFDTLEAGSDKLTLIQVAPEMEEGYSIDTRDRNTVYYPADHARWKAEQLKSPDHLKGDGLESATQASLLIHEFGHTSIGARALNQTPIQGQFISIGTGDNTSYAPDMRTLKREEYRATIFYENPYRKYMGMPLRRSYFNENDVPSRQQWESDK